MLAMKYWTASLRFAVAIQLGWWSGEDQEWLVWGSCLRVTVRGSTSSNVTEDWAGMMIS